jgi:hypothetical protein
MNVKGFIGGLWAMRWFRTDGSPMRIVRLVHGTTFPSWRTIDRWEGREGDRRLDARLNGNPSHARHQPG